MVVAAEVNQLPERRGRRRAFAVLLAMIATATVAASSPAPAQVTTMSGGISVSQTTDLDPNGQWVEVSGSGYDTWEGRGLYVAFCLVPPPGQRPTPCGGGQGGSGSAWFAADQYGVDNGATPFGPGGSFSTSVLATPTIGSVDCRRVQCAVVTFTDHRNLTDRSQDSIVPVSFAVAPVPPTGDPGGGSGGGAVPDAGTAPPAAAPEVAAPDLAAIAAAVEAERLAVLPAPVSTLAEDGLSVTDGTRTLRVDRNEKLSATSDTVKVAGHGFDPTKSIDVSLCRMPTAGASPAPCLGDGGGAGAAWVASGPSPEGRVPTDTFGADGTFAVELRVRSVLADGVDCRTTPCAVVTRNDASRPNDRSQDLVIPLSFARADAAPTSDTAARGDEQAQAVVDDESSGGAGATPWIIGGIVVVLAAGVLTVVVRRLRSGAQEA